MNQRLSRRQLMAGCGVCLASGAVTAMASAAPAAAARANADKSPFRYCLNTATMMGHKLPLSQEVELAAKAGYSGIEPWTRSITQHVEGGKGLKDLAKRIADLGLSVESAIGFASWAAEDERQRTAGLETMQREMDLVAQLGGKRIAAPPAGINRTAGVDLRKVAERYRAVLELGRKTGVVPQLEIWGAALTLGTVAEAAFVAVAADHPDACLLLDAFHMYKGGSGFSGLKLLSGAALHVFHLNDYPADPPREKISDAQRVYPGDGVAPLRSLLGDLHTAGFRGALSLELFNPEYWKQDPLTVARTGLEKMRAVAAKLD
jgi:sugar phosphate isomerase/epimerase